MTANATTEEDLRAAVTQFTLPPVVLIVVGSFARRDDAGSGRRRIVAGTRLVSPIHDLSLGSM